MKGILTDISTGDLMVHNGALVVGDTDGQVAELVLGTLRGEWKEYPLLGLEAEKMLGGNRDVMWASRARRQLRACGLEVSNITVADGLITIE